MGNRSVYAINSALSTWKEIFEMLYLSESDISRFFDEFTTLPVTNLKQLILPISDVQEALYKSETHFPQAVFSMFDCDVTKNINFGEYVCVLWSLCTLPESEYSNFILEIYDENGGGTLSSDIVSQLLVDLCGDQLSTSALLAEIQKKIAAVPGGSFTEVTFAEFCGKFPVLLVPLQLLRRQLRCTVMGEKFWERHSQLRNDLKGVTNVTKLRFLLLRCRHALTSRSMSSVYLRAASAKITGALSRANLKSAKVYASDANKVPSDAVTDTSSKKSLAYETSLD